MPVIHFNIFPYLQVQYWYKTYLSQNNDPGNLATAQFRPNFPGFIQVKNKHCHSYGISYTVINTGCHSLSQVNLFLMTLIFQAFSIWQNIVVGMLLDNLILHTYLVVKFRTLHYTQPVNALRQLCSHSFSSFCFSKTVYNQQIKHKKRTYLSICFLMSIFT